MLVVTIQRLRDRKVGIDILRGCGKRLICHYGILTA
jgi:hypothetical protein